MEYHYEGIKGTAGNVISGTELHVSEFGVYKAQVEVNGIPKTANGTKIIMYLNKENKIISAFPEQ